MLLDRSEAGARATTAWHRCPCCNKVRLTSELGKTQAVFAQTKPFTEDRADNRLNRFSKPRRAPA